MKIYSMTATFGKLENETLTLKPGLNIIHAPNEWGKSTWCAFLTAMLYGIETRVHTTKTAIADKERYAPWSGTPMAGRIDFNWNGRDITIERSSKGRSVFGVFRAYETASGLDVPELTAANCGQMLLGVEKSVFLRAGFIKLNDLPVTQDEALRRRLNAMVTTGDESGTADTLAQTLKDLKNRCRLNRSTGLLPQAETQQRELQYKLNEIRQLQEQTVRIRQRLEELDAHHKALLNHKTALQYAANRTYQEQLSAAEAALSAARAREQLLQRQCQTSLPADEAERALSRLRQLRDQLDALHVELRMLPPAPRMPETPGVFQGLSGADATALAEDSTMRYAQSSKKHPFFWLCALCFALGLVGLFLPHPAFRIGGGVLMGAGLVMLLFALSESKRRRDAVQSLLRQFSPIPPEQWVDAACRYDAAQTGYLEALAQHEAQQQAILQRQEALQQQVAAVTGGSPMAELEYRYSAVLDDWAALAEATREHRRADTLVQTLRSAQTSAPAPEFPDTMAYSEADTNRLLSDCVYEQRQLQQQLDRCHGKIEASGQESALRQQLEAVTERIRKLELTYSALEIAQSTLTVASNELQRRFSPQISKRAQTLFGKLTDGRYTRLTLGDDLTIHAGTDTESTLHSALWRSEGTVDQLYLALRLAVAGELTPDAPLVLDDALVRFDDRRLAEALDVLTEEAETKQVILFTCQTREQTLLNP